MRILLVHNHYLHAGGEDRVVEDEAALLTNHGHSVSRFEMRNDGIDAMGRLQLARTTLWNSEAYGELRRTMRNERPQIVHLHNTFPLISPAAYYAASREGAAVVQTLHNYRLICPNALLLRDGRPCEDCVGKSLAWPAVAHGCYRGSRTATAATAAMLSFHRSMRTWIGQVDLYIALTEFARGKFIKGGLPADRMIVKPNFAACASGPGTGSGGYGVLVGRLSEEKGIRTLLEAWKKIEGDAMLRIVGDGPLAPLVQSAAVADPRIQWFGHRQSTEVMEIIGDARFLVVPSNCYETFGRAAVEAFARGTPVIASNHGALAELVDDGRTGLLFEPTNAADLAAKVHRILAMKSEESTLMRQYARREWESRYAPETNYHMLMAAYKQAMSTSLARGRSHRAAA